MGLFSKIKNMFKGEDTKNNDSISKIEIDDNRNESTSGVSEEVFNDELVEKVVDDSSNASVEEDDEVGTEINTAFGKTVDESGFNAESVEVKKRSLELDDEEEDSDFEDNDYSDSEDEVSLEEETSENSYKDEVINREEVKIYEKGLTKSRQGFVSKLASLTTKYKKVNEEYFEELEEILIMADIGVNTVMSFMERLRKRVKSEKIESPEYLKEVIVDELFIIYVNDEVLVNKINFSKDGPTVLLFVGVNGVGKTTTIGKLAWKLKNEGKKVLLVAGDTFRAGATKQLEEWSERCGVSFVGKEEGADPASVVYDGIEKAKNENYDVVMVDTAGRLQNKVNLMKELEKINRVIKKIIPEAPHETLLIIDATTGQNGISQAKSFKEITDITGIVLTKLDGTAKGGIVLAIKEEVNLPVKYIGLGEAKEDLQVFDIEKYIYGLFKDMM